MSSNYVLGSKVMDWKTAAQCLGEQLASVGPENYYNFTPEQWFQWALKQIKR